MAVLTSSAPVRLISISKSCAVLCGSSIFSILTSGVVQVPESRLLHERDLIDNKLCCLLPVCLCKIQTTFQPSQGTNGHPVCYQRAVQCGRIMSLILSSTCVNFWSGLTLIFDTIVLSRCITLFFLAINFSLYQISKCTPSHYKTQHEVRFTTSLAEAW